MLVFMWVSAKNAVHLNPYLSCCLASVFVGQIPISCHDGILGGTNSTPVSLQAQMVADLFRARVEQELEATSGAEKRMPRVVGNVAICIGSMSI